MLEEYRVDLHIHSCLSPCAEDSMTPPEIVRWAAASGLDWIGIADHNAADNVEAAMSAAAGSGIALSPGMEITTAEEIHLLAFFDEAGAALELSRIVDGHLQGRNDEEAFGKQLVVDAEGRIRRLHSKLLIGATTLTAAEASSLVRGLGGVLIASHVDRPSYSVVSQLGFVPASLRLDAAELSPRVAEAREAAEWAERLGLPVVRFSDAHAPGDVGRSSTRLRVAAPTVAELRRALAGTDGREILAQ